MGGRLVLQFIWLVGCVIALWFVCVVFFCFLAVCMCGCCFVCVFCLFVWLVGRSVGRFVIICVHVSGGVIACFVIIVDVVVALLWLLSCVRCVCVFVWCGNLIGCLVVSCLFL